ncbi:hypothetical protein CK503_04285 [Aliifodinibius salipaludis]|uniref:Uncharacterized protein n=1 Tax=Fodinibius salipaludis TaxID=2032627 RepID=A0A2A2GBH3_9BACT|nr:hypothetical protein [Aliifodinibius salipaludis]PAU94698.1 hypothetical protein CK503_04285 [Aliifodinibius salipaludis]
MTNEAILQRLRRFLFGVVAFTLIGIVVELILLEHTEETLQWIPFIASIVGGISVATAWLKPNGITLKAFRWIMVGMIVISFLGVYFHFQGNLDFIREINPSYSLSESIWPAIKGSYPLLAPGVFFLVGILGSAATYKHPKLEE